jgi:hypothetical protein
MNIEVRNKSNYSERKEKSNIFVGEFTKIDDKLAKNYNINYDLWNKHNFFPWKEKLDEFFKNFVNGDHKLKLNYNINYDDFDEITLLTVDDKIAAFSSVYHRNIWPSNIRRILNRFIANKEVEFKSTTFGILSKIIHDVQIEYCKNNQIDFVFISMEGQKSRFISHWTKLANEHCFGWVHPDGFYKVCNGQSKSCLQRISYKNISGTKSEFPFLNSKITLNEYQKLIKLDFDEYKQLMKI